MAGRFGMVAFDLSIRLKLQRLFCNQSHRLTHRKFFVP
jgi:hypothetical protein